MSWTSKFGELESGGRCPICGDNYIIYKIDHFAFRYKCSSPKTLNVRSHGAWEFIKWYQGFLDQIEGAKNGELPGYNEFGEISP